jgi:hypothetical protein
MSIPSFRAASRILALAGIALALTACGGSRAHSASSIRKNLTPELDTQVMRVADTRNMFWHTWNGNVRQGWDDFYRASLYDRPVRLSRFPSPH